MTPSPCFLNSIFAKLDSHVKDNKILIRSEVLQDGFVSSSLKREAILKEGGGGRRHVLWGGWHFYQWVAHGGLAHGWGRWYGEGLEHLPIRGGELGGKEMADGGPVAWMREKAMFVFVCVCVWERERERERSERQRYHFPL
jgi:hypothetical protein